MQASVSARVNCEGPRHWVLTIEAHLERVAQARKDTDDKSNCPFMFRVPSYIKTLQPLAYDHRVLSFGLYNRDFEKMNRLDEARLEVVSCFLEQMEMTWDTLCECVAGPLVGAQALQDLYDDGPDERLVTPTMVRSVLTFDAVFLMLFSFFFSRDLKGSKHSFRFDRFERIFHQKGVKFNLNALYLDLWLLENQIPLFMIRNVWNQAFDDSSDHLFNTHTSRIIHCAMTTYLLPLAKVMSDGDHDHGISYLECNHLLHCLYITVCHHDSPASAPHAPPQHEPPSHVLNTDPGATTRRNALISPGTFKQQGCLSSYLSPIPLLRRVQKWVKSILPFREKTQTSCKSRSLLPITELRKAGIVIKGTQTNLSDIKFVKASCLKAILYLPQIDIDDNTETILRNLAAFEMIHGSNEHNFEFKLISYLSIMDDLINTEEDVRLLRKGKEPVIGVNYLGDDKDIAALFNALGQNVCFTKSEQCRSLTEEVNNWCRQENRGKLRRFIDRFNDRPWIFISLIAAILLLGFTTLQTVYAIVQFYRG